MKLPCLTGSAYRVSVPVRREDLVLTAGAPTVHVKTAESGARRAQAFCGHCGSPLYTYDADDLSAYGLRVGCIEQRRLLVPSKQVWCRSALPWSMSIEALPRHEKGKVIQLQGDGLPSMGGMPAAPMPLPYVDGAPDAAQAERAGQTQASGAG